MGWDDWNGDGVNADAKPPDVEKKHLGYKEYEVEVDVVFTVKYKVIAKDDDDLREKKMNLGGVPLEIDTDRGGECYDMRIKNWGTENEKTTETGDVVIQKKIDDDEPESEDNVEYELERNF